MAGVVRYWLLMALVGFLLGASHLAAIVLGGFAIGYLTSDWMLA